MNDGPMQVKGDQSRDLSIIGFGIVILDIALLIEGGVYSKFNQLISDAVSILVIEGLQPEEPE
jgi:hypothetical protein